MNQESIIEPYELPDWPDWNTRYGGNGPVRSIAVEQVVSAPAPKPYKPVIPMFLPKREPRKPGEFPERCPDGGEHHMVSNGKDSCGAYRLKCRRCRANRKATDAECAELRANGGRRGRK